MRIFDLVPTERMECLIDEADLIITHGGVGSVISSVKMWKKEIASPRLAKYGEHTNDHQLQIIIFFG